MTWVHPPSSICTILISVLQQKVRDVGCRGGRGLWEDSLCSSVYCFHVVQPVTKLGCWEQWLIHTLRSRAWNERAGSAKALRLMIAPWHHTANPPTPFLTNLPKWFHFRWSTESPGRGGGNLRGSTWDSCREFTARVLVLSGFVFQSYVCCKSSLSLCFPPNPSRVSGRSRRPTHKLFCHDGGWFFTEISKIQKYLKKNTTVKSLKHFSTPLLKRHVDEDPVSLSSFRFHHPLPPKQNPPL